MREKVARLSSPFSLLLTLTDGMKPRQSSLAASRNPVRERDRL